jgi:ubiquitin-like protein ATG12
MSSSATSRHAHERSRSNIDIDSTTAGEVDTQNDPTEGDLPMSMMASVILTNLPKDASQALKDVEEIDNFKGKSLCTISTDTVCSR